MTGALGHDPLRRHFARALADRYVVLSRGEVVKAGKGADMDADGVRACLTV